MSQKQSRRQAVAFLNQICGTIEDDLSRNPRLIGLRTLWQDTKDLVAYVEVCNRIRFPSLKPLTPDDCGAVRRLMLLRLEIIKRTMRLLPRQKRRRK